MKYTIKKILYNLLILNIFLIINIFTLSFKINNNQTLIINSLKQSIDIKHNINIFTKNVIIKKDSIIIYADKVLIIYSNTNQKNFYIKAYGNPVFFSQIKNINKPIKGYAKQIYYNSKTQSITLIGNVFLKQLNNNIKSDRIIYLINKEQIQAFSKKNKHITTTLILS
ncbi:Lipopolysaccharide export system protein LptA [Serratia symbiotica]|nr:Lipopolysaccharide export system protein LptA [Serratia symbiotica]